MISSLYTKVFGPHYTEFRELLDPIPLLIDLEKIKIGDKIGLRPEIGRIVIQSYGNEEQVFNVQGFNRWLKGDSREGLEKICPTLKCLLEWYPLHEYPNLAQRYKSAITGLENLQHTYHISDKVSNLIKELKLSQTDPRYVVEQLSKIDDGDTFSIEEPHNKGEILIKLTKKNQEIQKQSQEIHWLRLGLKSNALWQDPSPLVKDDSFQNNLEQASQNLTTLYNQSVKKNHPNGSNSSDNLSTLNLHAEHLLSIKKVLLNLRKTTSNTLTGEKNPLAVLAEKTKELWDKETISKFLVMLSMKNSQEAVHVYMDRQAKEFVKLRDACSELRITSTEI